jgi:hypothetical protein
MARSHYNTALRLAAHILLTADRREALYGKLRGHQGEA